jgi:sRNA-binding carbon storage regulator CsrA
MLPPNKSAAPREIRLDREEIRERIEAEKAKRGNR